MKPQSEAVERRNAPTEMKSSSSNRAVDGAALLKFVKHYQRDLERESNDDDRIIHCIEKLYQLPVTVQLLQDTGVGRTVNALRKREGEVSTASRALVAKWKQMVADEEEELERSRGGRNNGNDHDSHDDESASPSPAEDDDYSHRLKVDSPPPERDHETEQSNYVKHHAEKRKWANEDDRSKKKLADCQVVEKQHDSKSDSESSDDESGVDDNVNGKDSDEEEDKNNDEDDSDEETDIRSREKDSESENEGPTSKQSHSKHVSSESKLSPEKHNRHRSPHRSTSSRTHSSGSDRHKSDKTKHKHSSSSEDAHRKSSKMSSPQISPEKPSTSASKSSDEKNPSSHRSKPDAHKERKHDNDRASSKEAYSSHDRHKDKKSDAKSSGGKSRDDKRGNTSSSDGSHKERSRHEHRTKDSDSKSSKRHSDEGKSSHSNKSRENSVSSNKKENKDSENRKRSHRDENAKEMSKSGSKDNGTSKSSKSKSKESEYFPDTKKKKQFDVTDGIDGESGASFAEALGMISPKKSSLSQKKKSSNSKHIPNPPETHSDSSNDRCKSPDDLNSLLRKSSSLLVPLPPLKITVSALPEISPNYVPRPPPKLLDHPIPCISEEEAMKVVMNNKNQRTKVFSGNKSIYGTIPSLRDLCIFVLQENITALEYTGGVPYDIIKPVVDKATPEQLFMLEHYNPYLIEDTDPLWQMHCQRKFRNKQRQEMESWREMYMRCCDEQEAKLKSLTANIKLLQDKSQPVRQTKMAYVDSVVKPPRAVARKQAIYGTARKAVASPAARVPSLANSTVFNAASTSRVGASSPTAPLRSVGFIKPKKAPLMQKALQFMKGRNKR